MEHTDKPEPKINMTTEPPAPKPLIKGVAPIVKTSTETGLVSSKTYTLEELLEYVTYLFKNTDLKSFTYNCKTTQWKVKFDHITYYVYKNNLVSYLKECVESIEKEKDRRKETKRT